ncbi:hypothetical protein DL764_004636 [Monosporascus ibericus]|uniref:Uncharacterized protein n=1 Tax=Monosporascus ibericus TaxID=155417 RepID=A0A4Q4TFF4_9PEZI|nr:hypothetical protein DL764_004636 [Monosporascus ibericus]
MRAAIGPRYNGPKITPDDHVGKREGSIANADSTRRPPFVDSWFQKLTQPVPRIVNQFYTAYASTSRIRGGSPRPRGAAHLEVDAVPSGLVGESGSETGGDHLLALQVAEPLPENGTWLEQIPF